MSKDKENKGEMVSISICGGMNEPPLSMEELETSVKEEDNKKTGK